MTKRLIAGFLATTALALGVPLAHADDITGAGATFPYPAYAKWAEAYKAQTGKALNYQSIGSGGGIKQIRAKTVDFGASDMPLKPEELKQDGMVQFPAIIGGVVPVFNLEGISPGQMKLTGTVLADIYLGKIKSWNDPAIAGLNPGLKLPALPITVVRRSDGSGTTFLFTNYLSKVSTEWKDKVGAGSAISWPEGVGGKGNEGVASYVQNIKGSIGYVEYAYAKRNKMNHAQLRNKDGNFIDPDDDTFAAAAANAAWDKVPNFYEILTEQPGKNSWPITGASFILVYTNPQDPKRALDVLSFFSWSFRNGQKMAAELDYVPIPDPVVKLIETMWKAEIKSSSGAVWK